MKKETLSLIVIVAVMWTSHMLVDFMIGIWAVYKTIAGLDLALAGLIAGASALIGESLQGFFGPMADKGYRQRLVVFGIGLTIASVLMSYTENYMVLFLFFLLTCIGSGAFHPAAVGVMNELSEKRKALLMTIFQSGGALGLAFSQIIFSQTYFLLEGHTFFLAIPSVLLMALIIWKGYGSQAPKAATVELAPQKGSWSTFGSFFRSKDMSALYFTQLCNQSLFWGAVFMLPDVLVGRGYDDWLCFGGAHLFLIIGGAVMMVPAGYLADKHSCKSVILVAFALGFVSFYAFLVNPFLSPLALCMLLFVLGAALGTVSPVVVALGNRLRPGQSGIVSAFLMGLVWCVAEGIGQGGGGLLTKLFSDNPAAYALACLGILLIVGLAFASRLPKEETTLAPILESI